VNNLKKAKKTETTNSPLSTCSSIKFTNPGQNDGMITAICGGDPQSFNLNGVFGTDGQGRVHCNDPNFTNYTWACGNCNLTGVLMTCGCSAGQVKFDLSQVLSVSQPWGQLNNLFPSSYNSYCIGPPQSH